MRFYEREVLPHLERFSRSSPREACSCMTAQLTVWFIGLAVAGAMVAFGMELGQLARPRLHTRCGACGRLVRRGKVCPCSRTD
jgi:hypothetical protein